MNNNNTQYRIAMIAIFERVALVASIELCITLRVRSFREAS